MNIINKVVGENKKAWDRQVKYALWVDNITTKTYTKRIPFEIVYGLEANLSVNFQIPILHFAQQYTIDQEKIQGQID